MKPFEKKGNKKPDAKVRFRGDTALVIIGYFFGLCPAPSAAASGLLEDVTKKLGPDIRLWASFLSALVALYLWDAVVRRSG